METETLKKYYDEHIADFTDVLHTAHVLVDSEELAEELYKKAVAGEDFAALAKKNSKCPSGAEGGDLGFVPHGMFVPPFEKATLELKSIGEISKPVQSQFGFHIIKLIDKKAVMSFDEAKETIEMILTHRG